MSSSCIYIWTYTITLTPNDKAWKALVNTRKLPNRSRKIFINETSRPANQESMAFQQLFNVPSLYSQSYMFNYQPIIDLMIGAKGTERKRKTKLQHLIHYLLQCTRFPSHKRQIGKENS